MKKEGEAFLSVCNIENYLLDNQTTHECKHLYINFTVKIRKGIK